MIFSLGEGNKGELGLSSKKEVNEPTIISSMLNYRVFNISSGKNHSLAIATLRDLQVKTEDDVKENFLIVFGDNSKGQLGLENVSHVEVPIINENFSNKKLKKVECGLNHSSVLLSTNEVYVFGAIRPSSNKSNNYIENIEKPLKVDYKLTGFKGIKDENELFTDLSSFADSFCSQNNVYLLSSSKSFF